mgnify:CR=1 FL=1
MKRLWLICLVLLAFCISGCASKETPTKEVHETKVAYEVIDEGGSLSVLCCFFTFPNLYREICRFNISS